MTTYRGWLPGALLLLWALVDPVLASVGGGGSRIMGTDFLVELHTVASSVWIPVGLLLVLIGTAVGIGSGRLRFSDGICRILVLALLVGGGVTAIANMIGAPATVALIW